MHRTAVVSTLAALVHRAHEDARQHLRNLAGISLDPVVCENFIQLKRPPFSILLSG